MNSSAAFSPDDLCDCILLPSQFNDLRSRSFPLGGEYRLLWAVLADAIRIYLTNRESTTPNRRKEFVEAHNWFHTPEDKPCSLFAFHTICDVLGIEPKSFLKRLESTRVPALPRRRYRIVMPSSAIRCSAVRKRPGRDGSYAPRSNRISDDPARSVA
jgi:hypothetical protein